ncbi:hypothetical protein CAPTEDRAFT_185497 [Capitella teleta]|uniref:RBD domain-containing protein n=1 Tax=Capitella teleta TaxID=283909 RepID=R7VD09_CAPTE|nr:hypothetical protein CAPTEDRAFT_185497 [Capitella teleta]|eukprot:ELU16534.1 hypothetical protein CAPTEDRAFT_185497 [Capitella teleta]
MYEYNLVLKQHNSTKNKTWGYSKRFLNRMKAKDFVDSAQLIFRRRSTSISLGTEYFTLRFDVVDKADIQVVAAVKGVTLRNAISSACESRNINIDAIDIFLSSSNTALPKDGDCYHFGGSNLHIRSHDGASSPENQFDSPDDRDPLPPCEMQLMLIAECEPSRFTIR